MPWGTPLVTSIVLEKDYQLSPFVVFLINFFSFFRLR